jgi:acetolactate synthase-1/2/3 large subunit
MLALKEQKEKHGLPEGEQAISGSEALIRSLIAEKADVIFGYPGGAIMPVYDALYQFREQLSHILVRHEQGASHAAEGYARTTGKAGVCLATSGPGATNLITGLADALIDSVPLVCITGQVPSSFLGTDAFQETDIMSLSSPVTKWNYQITQPDEIAEVLAKAFYLARSGRPGPVLIDITKDAQLARLSRPFLYKTHQKVAGYTPKPSPGPEAIVAAADLINKAQKPILFVGHGVQIAGAEQQLLAFTNKTGIPVASTLMGLSAFPTRHPLYTGMLGMHGNYGPNMLSNQADLVIAVGMRFDDRVTCSLKGYLAKAKVIHIEIDAAEIHKNVKADVALHADAREALDLLLPLVESRQHTSWLEEFACCYQEEYSQVIRQDTQQNKQHIRMGEVVQLLASLSPDNAIMVADVGQHQMVAARYSRFDSPNSWITSGGLGTMGFALPAALGAQLGAPRRPVVAFIGDGGFQMTLQELGTIAQYRLPVKIILLNNSYLGMVRQWQEMFFDRRYSFVEMQNPDFVAIAKGYGIAGKSVKEGSKLEEALQTALRHDGPYLLEVQVEKEEKVFPMIVSGDPVDKIRLK